MTNKHEQHVRALREMRCVMIEDDNWENLQRFIEAVTAGGMAIQMLDEKAFTQQKTGNWIAEENEEMETVGYYCSECDLPMETENQTRFCPNCGAKMVDPQESEVSDADSN